MKLSLAERMIAPQLLEETLVQIEYNKHEIDRLREKNIKLKEYKEKLVKVINENQDFFKYKKVIVEDK